MVDQQFQLCNDNLSSEPARALLREQFKEMRANTPAGSVPYVLDLSGLTVPGITVWSIWKGYQIASLGAVKAVVPEHGEIKSMRTVKAFLRQVVAAALLDHVIDMARQRGITRLGLETGCLEAFEPALALYRKRGFVNGPPFADYEQGNFNQFRYLRL